MSREDELGRSEEGGLYNDEELRSAVEEYSQEELQREAAYDDQDPYPDTEAAPSAENEEDGPDPETDNSAGRRSRRGGRRSALEWIIIGVLVVVFVVSVYQVVSQMLIYQTAIDEYEELSSYFEEISQEETDPEETEQEEAEPEEEEPEEETEKVSVDYPALAVDYDSLYDINEEFIGVIHIPALNLTYPMVQTTNNTAYLTKTFEGTTNSSGCIFLDTLASPDFSDRNSFIFGHNMKNQTMFGSLKLFQQQDDLCDSDPYIYIYQEDQVLVYRIFAYYTIPVEDDVYEDFVGDDGYDDYVDDALYHSIYTLEDGVIDWSERPNLLTLSTCYSTGHTHNFIVQAALIGTAEL